jgi:hypothetical protein
MNLERIEQEVVMKHCLTLAAILALGACSAAPAPSLHADGQVSHPNNGRDCFDTNFVQGFSSQGKNVIRLDVGPGQKYDVDIAGAQCDQVDWTQRLALESTPSSWICVGDAIGQGNVYFRDPTTRRRLSCYIQNVRRVPEQPATSG